MADESTYGPRIVDIVRWVRASELPHAQRLILIMLASRDGPRGIFPSLSRLASDCDIGRATLARELIALERAGLIRRTRRTEDGSREPTSTLYEISIPAVASLTERLPSPAEGLGSVTQGPGSPAAGPQVVPQRDGGSPAAGPDLGSDLGNGSGERESAREDPDPPRATTPEAEAAASTDALPPEETGYDLARRVWDDLWSARYHESYPHRPDLGPRGEDRVLQRVGQLALTRGGARRAESYVRHWMGSYLRDHGDRDYLVSRRHPLRCLERDLQAYGEPRGTTRAPSPDPTVDDAPRMSPHKTVARGNKLLSALGGSPKKTKSSALPRVQMDSDEAMREHYADVDARRAKEGTI